MMNFYFFIYLFKPFNNQLLDPFQRESFGIHHKIKENSIQHSIEVNSFSSRIRNPFSYEIIFNNSSERREQIGIFCYNKLKNSGLQHSRKIEFPIIDILLQYPKTFVDMEFKFLFCQKTIPVGVKSGISGLPSDG